MFNKTLRKIIASVMILLLAFSGMIYASASSDMELTAVYGDTLADLTLPDGYLWVAEDPELVSVGAAGTKSFPAKTLNQQGVYENIAIKIVVEPAYISEVYASTDSSHYYTGKPVVPEVKAYFNGKELTENVDYKLICSDNINVGTAKITVEGIGNFKGKTSFYFSIVKKDVEGIYLNPTEAELVSGKTVELVADVITDDATFKGVTWSSSDVNIASVDENGVVTAVNEGVATVTATTNDGSFTAECVINVVVHDEESDHKYRHYDSFAPGCETEGSVIYKCMVCDHKKTETVPATGHTYVECHEFGVGGLHRLYCGDCDKTANQTHTYTEWVSNGDATFFNNGTKMRSCVYCEYSETLTEENSSVILRIISSIYEMYNSYLITLSEFINGIFAV